MSFSDDDLTRLKEIIRGPAACNLAVLGNGMSFKLNLNFLLARLEAAEAYVVYLEDRASHDWGPEGLALFVAWRKACGK